jgi:uncharacterized protein involved in response to NO
MADNLLENPSNLVLGMGVGVFVIFIFSIVLALVFALTGQSSITAKILWRGGSTVTFMTIMLILVFSERESRFYYAGFEQQIYDDSVIPRISICCVMMLFTLVSAVLLFEESGTSKETSTVDVDENALWQE